MVADVEVNVALSGGIDSSLINYFTSKFNSGRSITVRFSEDAYDESSTAAGFARHLGAKHSISDVSVTNQVELLNKLLIHFDQPYGDSSLIPFYFLSKTAAGFSKVIMGGDGGDEIHNGYNSQRLFPFLSSIRSHSGAKMASLALKAIRLVLPAKQSRVMMKFGSMLATHNGHELAFNLLSWFPALLDQYPINPFKYDVDNLYKGFVQGEKVSLRGGALMEAVLFQERLTSDYLRKADMMSMINSVEYRIPMLDEDLVAFSLSIPNDQKSNLFNSKKMLRAMHATHFPSSTSKLKKQGFSLPLDRWLGDLNLEYIENYILDKKGIVLNYIVPEYIKILFRTLKEEKLLRYCSRESAYQRILILYSLQLWYCEIFL
jgi:asparagine synthase (glutamine-hydrolysing)